MFINIYSLTTYFYKENFICNWGSFFFLDNGASQLESDTLPKALVAFWWAPEIRRFESRSPLSAPPSVTPAAAAHIVRTNVSYVMEFLARWVQKSKVFAQKSTCLQMKLLYFENWHRVGPTKIGPNFRKKSGSKIKSGKKNVFNKKWCPKLIFLDELFFWKSLVDFCHR